MHFLTTSVALALFITLYDSAKDLLPLEVRI
jgi:hypothetical protein